MKRIIIALLACATVALAGVAWIGGSDNVTHAKAGKVSKFTPPIAGGIQSSTSFSPYMVWIDVSASTNEDSLKYRSGAIIGDQWVLTSARALPPAIRYGYYPVVVLAGVQNNALSSAPPSPVSRTSTDIRVHESFVTNEFHDDIALIRLSQPLPFNYYIQPINLDSSGNDWAGQVVRLVGWGDTDPRYFSSGALYSATNPIITNAQCANVYGSNLLTPGMGCFSGAGGRGACNGDQGGAVVINNDTLVGIISYFAEGACNAGYPTGFTRIAQYRQWITQKTGI